MSGFGIDLSHHQDPDHVPWDRFPGVVGFVICRASYGGGLRDRCVNEHMRRARQTGAKVGLYQFFRPSQSVDAHFAMLWSVAESVGLGPGDIVPALDIELDPVAPAQPVSSEWEPCCRELVERMVATWGDAIVYITQREWGMLGRPDWVLKRPLWVAHYTQAAMPASPGDVTPCIWQNYVGPFNPQNSGGYDRVHPELDQNRQLGHLPLIADKPAISDDDRERIMGLVALTLDGRDSPVGAVT